MRNIALKSKDDIARIAEAGIILRNIFAGLGKEDLSGHTTLEIDESIHSAICSCHARSAFETLRQYKHASCISLNDELVHGIPSKKRRIVPGDIVSIDIGVVKNGYFADACRTFVAGSAGDEKEELVSAARTVLDMAIDALLPGQALSEIGRIIEHEARKLGCEVFEQFTGHGVGFALHEYPVVLHYYDPSLTLKLREGMVLAVEPVIGTRKAAVFQESDGWTVKTVDGTLGAQFEETVAVTSDGPRILS